MSRASALAAWVCAVACLAAAPVAFDGVPRATFALAPFLFVAGLPTRRPQPVWRVLAVAAPPFGLAAALDLARAGVAQDGFARAPLEALAWTGVQGTLMLVLLADAARRASATRARMLHGPLWFTGVLWLPLAAAVTGWDGAPGGAPALLSAAARLSPLEWVVRAPGALAPAPLFFVVGLWMLVARSGGGAIPEEGGDR